jgi:hypothetical protein
VTVKVTSYGDSQLRDKLDYIDEFRFAEPCWRTRVWNQLPPETITTVVKITPSEEVRRMAIKVIQEAQAPARLFHRGAVSSKQEYADVQNALRDMKPGQALIVDMDAKAWEGVKKAETTFSANLRRGFEVKGLLITAYQSGPMQITIRKSTALDKRPGRGGKRKS